MTNIKCLRNFRNVGIVCWLRKILALHSMVIFDYDHPKEVLKLHRHHRSCLQYANKNFNPGFSH